MPWERGLAATGRAPLFAALFVCAAINGVYFTLVESVRALGWGGAAVNFYSVSAFIWIALVAISQLAFDAPAQRTTRRDLAVLAGGLALCFLPTGWEARLSLLLSSAYLWRTSNPRTPERRIAIIAASLTAPLIWGRLALNFLAPELLHFDAALAGLLTGHDVQGNTVAFAPGAMADAGKRVVVFAGCSSFTNISLTAVVIALVTQMFDIPIRWRLLPFAAALAASMLVINLLRLAALASFPQQFEWLHVGLGATVFAYAGLIVMGAIAALAASNHWLRANA
jgi:exosortase/archaeosortase family protein